MSTTTMHFGPEWMRTKHQPLARSQPPPSPPPLTSVTSSGLSSYSALVSAAPPMLSGKADEAHPFRYSKDDLLRIYQEGGGKGGLGLEVERWEGVVREVGAEPVALRDMTEAEKKLFAGPLNSEIRRRPSQSTDYLSPVNTSGLERPRMPHSASATANSPLRERFGGIKRRDSSGGTSDLSTLTIPRKPSLSTLQAPALLSPREASPRTRVGYSSNFDGVLNNGESWVARRRASEAPMKVASVPSREEQASVGSGIQEEKEEEPAKDSQLPNGQGQVFLASGSPHVLSAEPRQYTAAGGAKNTLGVPNESFVTANGSSTSNPSEIDPPVGLSDLSAIEWSYKDPTGQVQGPFRADLMQKWFSDGYFTADLQMKRTDIDTHWTTVRDLITQASSEDIFLTPAVSVTPPGLTRGNSTLLGYPSEQVFNEPFQPAPIRSLRTSTLESYLTSGSIASDSPSSSLGASHFGNPSPDPLAFGEMENRPYLDMNGRASGFSHQEHHGSKFGNRMSGHEFTQDLGNNLQGTPYGNFASERDFHLNGHTFTNNHIPQDSWNPSLGQTSAFPGLTQNASSAHFIQSQSGFSHELIARGFSQGGGFASDIPGDFHQQSGTAELNALNFGSYDYLGNPAFKNAPEQQLYGSQIPDFPQNQQTSHTFGLRSLDPTSQTAHHVPYHMPPIPVQSPWKAIPASSTIQGLAVPEAPQFEVASSSADLSNDATPIRAFVDAPKDMAIPSSLTVGNLGQHNQQQQELVEALDLQKLAINEPEAQATSETFSASETPLIVADSAKPLAKTQSVQHSNVDHSSSPESAITPAVPKSAWAKEEETNKKKAAATSVSLREIQEAEAKKLENRKAIEREKERTRVSAAAEAKEDLQPFTTSWGLPTSQAGARNGISAKEVPPTTTPTSATPPVWTTSAKTPAIKKTMKEIQEEEERRKLAAKETLPAAMPKRAYAETTNKAVAGLTPVVTSSNSAWTTVGANGKTTSLVPSPVRPPAQASSSFSSAGPSTASRVTSPPVQRAPVIPVLKARPAVKTEELSETPSHEFLKWLSDSLKGLNNSVNVEEIMSMLLSFPLDADVSTLEIISDTIYANSTTLDGRRFATEFVTKRKVDAALKSKGASSANKVPAKPVSIADVVKAVPKPAQPEWGFKVVNKKKKGGRS